jgi:hypothetical protein
MGTRNGLLGLAGVFVLAGVAAARPTDPHVDGREPDPVAREFHAPQVVVAGLQAVPVLGSRSTESVAERSLQFSRVIGTSLPNSTPPVSNPLPLADYATGFRNAVMTRLTIPLGTVPIED